MRLNFSLENASHYRERCRMLKVLDGSRVSGSFSWAAPPPNIRARLPYPYKLSNFPETSFPKGRGTF